MIRLRRADERGRARFGWLDSRHTFSFGHYYDPAHMGFRSLRVINDDTVAPRGGFEPHPHRDMEIVSYVLEGALQHRDSMGNGSVIRPGEVQLMSAGTGVTHSEFNASETEPVHFLQIWVLPARQGTKPRYEQRAFPLDDRQDRWRVLVSTDGEDGSLTIGQDVRIVGALLTEGGRLTLEPPPGRHAWLHVATGSVRLGETALGAGDGVAISDEAALPLVGVSESELLWFDLA